jgi:uncharacterized membrane protein YqjE
MSAGASNETLDSPEPDMAGQLGNLGADLIHLGELQLELLAVDSRDAAQEARFPSLLSCLGLAFLMGSCPLALLGLSWWLADVTQLSLAAASLTIAALGLVLALGLLWAAWRGFKSSVGLLNRSRAELHSNLEWIKKILSEKHRHRRWPI